MQGLRKVRFDLQVRRETTAGSKGHTEPSGKWMGAEHGGQRQQLGAPFCGEVVTSSQERYSVQPSARCMGW